MRRFKLVFSVYCSIFGRPEFIFRPLAGLPFRRGIIIIISVINLIIITLPASVFVHCREGSGLTRTFSAVGAQYKWTFGSKSDIVCAPRACGFYSFSVNFSGVLIIFLFYYLFHHRSNRAVRRKESLVPQNLEIDLLILGAQISDLPWVIWLTLLNSFSSWDFKEKIYCVASCFALSFLSR